MSMETVEPPKNAESNGENASAPGVTRRGFGRLAVNSAVMIAILIVLLTLQDSHARSVATARPTAETPRTAILWVDVVHPSVGAASTEVILPASVQSLTIPSNTLLFRREGLRVGVVRDGRVQLVPISIGNDYGDVVEVTAGLTRADQVVLNPSDSLVSGTPVEIDSNAATEATE
jgi:hypothetical protein